MRLLDFLRALTRRRRRTEPGAERLDARALKDIGLSHADLPALRAGLLERDASRRCRGAESLP